jgi:hypothetical protein
MLLTKYILLKNQNDAAYPLSTWQHNANGWFLACAGLINPGKMFHELHTVVGRRGIGIQMAHGAGE